jgi:phosphonate transport system substrate-binding protein
MSKNMRTNNTKRNCSKIHKNKQTVIFHVFLLIILLGWIVGGIGCEPAPQYQGKAKILISPGPFSFPMMEARFIFLVDYLTKETGWKFDQIGAPPNDAAFGKMLETKRFDMAIVNPYLYLLLADRKGAVPVLKTISFDGKDSYRGLIVCRADSLIQSLSDLRGKQILAPSRSTVGGFISQWVLLKQQGLDPDRDLTYQFGVTQEEIIEKIVSRRGEVGFIREDVYEAMKKAKGHTPQIKVLAYTSFFPNPGVVIFPDTDPALVEKVKTALLNLKLDNPAHRFILERIRISGFSPASVEDYKDFRDLLISQGFFPSNVSPSSQTVPSQ